MRSLSLKYQLVLPFALLILLIPIGTGWMLYRSGAMTVNALVQRIQQEMLARINETTEARLLHAVNALNAFTGTLRDHSRGAAALSAMDVLECQAADVATGRGCGYACLLWWRRWTICRPLPHQRLPV